MRRSTIILGTAFGLLLAATVIFLAGSTLTATLNVATATGAEYPGAYASVSGLVATRATFQQFNAAMPADPAACRLEDVTLRLTNHGLVTAEWVSVTVEPSPGDVAVYSITGEGSAVPALGESAVNLKLVSNAGQPPARSYRIQYYVYGMKREITIQQTGAAPS